MNCCASGCRSEEGSARFGAGAGKLTVSKTPRSGAPAVLDVTSDGGGNEVSDAARNVVGESMVVSSEGRGREGSDGIGGVISDAASNVVGESMVASSEGGEREGVGGESVALSTAAELVAALASGLAPGLPADIEFGCGKLRLALELPPRFAARLEFDLELLFLLTASSALPANLAPGIAVVSSAAD